MGRAGIRISTVAGVMPGAFVRGLVAGYYRESTGSLVPAVLAHLLANMTGTLLSSVWTSWLE
jgi:membrane protease YdiL (CAAX protease family)